MRAVETLFADYAEHHRTPGNKWCHRVGIPVIMLSLLGMLARLDFWVIDAGMVLIAAAGIYYLTLDLRLGVMMVLISALFYLIGAWLPFWFNVALFVAGWILQFVGHARFEHRQPAFLKNVTHLLVGPLWLLDSLVSSSPLPATRGEGGAR